VGENPDEHACSLPTPVVGDTEKEWGRIRFKKMTIIKKSSLALLPPSILS
jgi:hypothetical protein